MGSWTPAPTGVGQPGSTAQPNGADSLCTTKGNCFVSRAAFGGCYTERQDVRQLSSRARLHAPVVVQRMLGNVEDAVFRVDQLRTVEVKDGENAPEARINLTAFEGAFGTIGFRQCRSMPYFPKEGKELPVATIATVTLTRSESLHHS